VTIRNATSASNSTSTRTITASCNGGESVIGGGGLVTNPGASVSMTSSYPASASTWTVDAVETDNYGSNWSITAYAICAT
jgi:hypothetical protein